MEKKNTKISKLNLKYKLCGNISSCLIIKTSVKVTITSLLPHLKFTLNKKGSFIMEIYLTWTTNQKFNILTLSLIWSLKFWCELLLHSPPHKNFDVYIWSHQNFNYRYYLSRFPYPHFDSMLVTHQNSMWHFVFITTYGNFDLLIPHSFSNIKLKCPLALKVHF